MQMVIISVIMHTSNDIVSARRNVILEKGEFAFKVNSLSLNK